MEEPRGTCPTCGRQRLRLTEKGLIWPHLSKAGDLCPIASPTPLVTEEDQEPRPKKGRKGR